MAYQPDPRRVMCNCEDLLVSTLQVSLRQFVSAETPSGKIIKLTRPEAQLKIKSGIAIEIGKDHIRYFSIGQRLDEWRKTPSYDGKAKFMVMQLV